jgi:hypothetical protein
MPAAVSLAESRCTCRPSGQPGTPFDLAVDGDHQPPPSPSQHHRPHPSTQPTGQHHRQDLGVDNLRGPGEGDTWGTPQVTDRGDHHPISEGRPGAWGGLGGGAPSTPPHHRLTQRKPKPTASKRVDTFRPADLSSLYGALPGPAPARVTVLALSAMVAAWVASLPCISAPPLSGGIAVVVTAASLPALLGSVPGVPPDQCPAGSHSRVSLRCRVVLRDPGSNVSVAPFPSRA